MAFLFPKYFPFCIPPEEETSDIPVGSGTAYPIGMSLADAMSLYWKSIAFSSGISYSAEVEIDNNGDPLSVSASYSQSGELSLNSPLWPTKMSEMICFSSAYGYPYYSGTSVGTGQIQSSSEEGLTVDDISSGVDFFSSSGDIVVVKDDAYYPRIAVYSILLAKGNNSYGVELSSILPVVNNSIIVDALSLNINNTEYKTDLFISISVNEFPFSPDSASSSFVINGLNDREAN
jgi:hypothetical protein